MVGEEIILGERDETTYGFGTDDPDVVLMGLLRI
jgi:hypothetical protein